MTREQKLEAELREFLEPASQLSPQQRVMLAQMLNPALQQYPADRLNRINKGNPATAIGGQSGYPGAQSGEGVRRSIPFSGPGPSFGGAGMEGSQSGPAEESTSAGLERIAQILVGYGGGALGGAAGMAITGGNPAGALPGMGAGIATIDNADTPNIQDVWAHKMMQRIRRFSRGLPQE